MTPHHRSQFNLHKVPWVSKSKIIHLLSTKNLIWIFDTHSNENKLLKLNAIHRQHSKSHRDHFKNELI